MENYEIVIKNDLTITLSHAAHPQPDLMRFYGANGHVGSLKIEGDQLVFEGNADQSAQSFFIVLKALVDAHLATYFGKV